MIDNIHYHKLTIIKLIDQCAHRCVIEDKPAFHNLCESAFEWAFNALGIEDNYIFAEDFYQLYDKVWTELNKSLGHEPPPISMLQTFRETTEPWIYEWEDLSEEEIAIKSGYIPFDDGGY